MTFVPSVRCGAAAADVSVAQSTIGRDRPEAACQEYSRIEKSNFAPYFACAYQFSKSAMTLPRKNSRSIAVDAVHFRYIVSRSGTGDEGLFSLNLAVQIASGRGCILKANGIFTRDSWLDFPEIESSDKAILVKPGQVAAVIRRARTSGWDPAEAAMPFLLTMTAAEFQT
jgi:hypothetical protein